MADFYIRAGDTASKMSDTLRDEDGTPVDIAGATIALRLEPIRGGEPTIDGAAASNDQVGDGSDGSRGKVSFSEWPVGSIDEPGDYLGTWVATFGGGKPLSFPNAGYILVAITPASANGEGYITAEELKRVMGGQGLTRDDDDIRESILAASQGLDRAYNGGASFRLGAAGEQRYYTPTTGMTTVDLGAVTDVTDVSVDVESSGAYSRALVPGTDYVLEGPNGRAPVVGEPFTTLRFLRGGIASSPWAWPDEDPLAWSRWPWGRDALRVTGTFGWPSVPAGVKRATKIIALRLLERPKMAPFGVVQVGGPDGVAVRAGDIARDPEVRFAMRGIVKRTLIV